MSEYWKSNGVHVYDFDKCIAALKQRYKDQENRIKYLEKENKELKYNNYKDAQLQKMKEKLDHMIIAYYRGFPISEDEQKAIDEWKREHETESHETCGGNYIYKFVPTSIGVSGIIECRCGAKFEFQEIG